MAAFSGIAAGRKSAFEAAVIEFDGGSRGQERRDPWEFRKIFAGKDWVCVDSAGHPFNTGGVRLILRGFGSGMQSGWCERKNGVAGFLALPELRP